MKQVISSKLFRLLSEEKLSESEKLSKVSENQRYETGNIITSVQFSVRECVQKTEFTNRGINIVILISEINIQSTVIQDHGR